MNPNPRPWPTSTGLFALLLVILAGCDNGPAAGQPCPTPGSVYAHRTLHLTCDKNGVWSK